MIRQFLDRRFLQQKYVVEGLSARQIAREIFSSKSAVLDALESFGFSIREPNQHHGNFSQLRYGQKFLKGKMVDDRAEQHVMEVVKELFERHLSFRKIAKILNRMNIPTKNQGKGWHPEMIRRVVQYIYFKGTG